MKTTEKDATRAAWTSAAAPSGGALARDTRGAGAGVEAGGAVLAPPLDPDAEPRASLWRYTKWKLKDFLRERGSWMLGLGALGVALFRYTYDGLYFRNDAVWVDQVRQTLMEEQYFQRHAVDRLGFMAFIGVLIATHGIVSRDRERGYQRFLFAKPLRATRYYLQSFLVNGAGFLGILALMSVCTMAAFARGLPVAGGLLVGAAAYAAIGGLVFLVSAVARYDFAIVVGTTVLALIVGNGRMLANEVGQPAAALASLLLPPIDSLGRAMNRLARGEPAAEYARWLVWPFLYGAACVSAAIAVIRRRSIAN